MPQGIVSQRAIVPRIRVVRLVSTLAVAAAACASLSPVPAQAQMPASEAAAAAAAPWVSVGPAGGNFSGLFSSPASPATVYLAVQNGAVWSSPDGGGTWQLAGTTGTATAVGMPALVVDPSRAGTAYANSDRGVLKTIDGGGTWEQLPGLVNLLAVAPSAPQTLYGSFGRPGSIWRSDDGGAGFSVEPLPPGFSFVTAIAVDPAAPQTAYVLGDGGFVKTADGGAHWIDPFSPAGSAADRPLALLLDPGRASTLYLTLQRPAGGGGAGAGIFRSDDAGATWTPAGAGLPGDLPLFGLVVAPSGALYATVVDSAAGVTRIFHSAAGGSSWQLVSSRAGRLSVAADFQSPDHLLLLGSAGVQFSDDGGATWPSPARQPSGAYAVQVAAGPAGGGSLYLLESGGPSAPFPDALLHSADGGSTWSTLARPPGLFPELVVDAQPGVLYSFDRFPVEEPLAVSVDDGSTWRALNVPKDPESIYPPGAVNLAADPLHPGKLAALVCGAFPAAPGQFVCRGYALFRTNTGGRGWRLLARMPNLEGPVGGGLMRLDPADRTRVYVILKNILFRTDPASLDLAQVPLAGPVFDLAIDPRSPATLYAATGRPTPFWKSLDRGASWHRASLGLPRGAILMNLAIDPTTPSTLYLATDAGLFVTDDGAATWHPLGTALPSSLIISMAVSTGLPRTVWAGTPGGGVFALTHP
jgi:photosystem II stability/assembly factor-like uncharacterized protein